jgi:hypothetical protein
MNFSSARDNFTRWLQRSPQPGWLKLAVVGAVIAAALFLLVHFWWLLAVFALGYALGARRR